MSTVIRNDSDFVRSLNIYNKTTTGMQKSMLKITSGLKINTAGDDPSTFAISERMKEQVSSTNQADENAQNDTSLLRVAEAAIASTIEVIQTLRARAVNAASGHNNDEDRAIIQIEAEKLLDSINYNSQAATFNGKQLLDGSLASEGLHFHVGGEANFYINLKLNDMSAEGLGLRDSSGTSILDLSTVDGAQKALGVQDSTGKYVHSITNADGSKTFGLLDTALNKALEEQTKLGAMEERLGFTRDTLNNTSENMQGAISTLLDTDMAKEMSSYVKHSILTQAAQLMFAQMNSNAMTTLDLLAPVR